MQQRRLAAIMFTDIVGYTSMMAEDEDRAFETLRRNRKIQKDLIKKYDGNLLKELGDGTLVSFTSSSRAVRCASEIQRESKKQGVPLRIGIHEGEVIFEDGDVLGDGVNIASRLQEVGAEGCVTISESVLKNIRNKSDIQTEYIKEAILKNVPTPIRTYQAYCLEDPQPPEASRTYQPFKRNHILIASFLVVIVAIAVLWRFTDFPYLDEQGKTIAIMPFANQSQDSKNQYYSDGIMDAIHNHLCKLNDLSVLSKSSVESYRHNPRSPEDVYNETGARYLLEGSVLMADNKIRVTVNLVESRQNRNIWSEAYERPMADIFELTRDIAREITSNVHITISSAEKSLIDKIPKISITAYERYLQAREYHSKFWYEGNITALNRAIDLYNLTVSAEPAYAPAYTGLAMAHWDKFYWEDYYEETFLDTILILAEKAISLDDELDEAWFIRSRYYREIGQVDQALRDNQKTIDLNPNFVWAIRDRGLMFIQENHDYQNGIQWLEKAVKLEHGKLLPVLLREIGDAYGDVGQVEQERLHYREAIPFDADSIYYYEFLTYHEKEPERILALAEKVCAIGQSHQKCHECMAFAYKKRGDYFSAAEHYFKYIESSKVQGQSDIANTMRIGYVFDKIGAQEAGRKFFYEHIDFCEESIKKNSGYARWYGLAYYDLAAIYAYNDKKDLAYQYLEQFSQQAFFAAWLVDLLQRDEMFETLRTEAKFKELEAKIIEQYRISVQAATDQLE